MDFLVIYAGADLPWARWIAWHSEAAGYSVRTVACDAPAAPPGELLPSTEVVAILSQRYVDLALEERTWPGTTPATIGVSPPVMAVRVEPCDPERALGLTVNVDLVAQLDESSIQATLLDAFLSSQGRRGRPPAYPPFERPAGARPRHPAANPEIWEVQYERQPNRFVGREDLLLELENRTSGARGTLQVLQGLAGVGKTRLAVEYAYRYRFKYTAVCWVRAGEPSTLVADFSALAGLIGLPHAGAPDQKLVLAAVRDWFEETDGWLLIFDGAKEPESVVSEGLGFERMRDFAPRDARGDILVTTQDMRWATITTPLHVDVLELPDAATFLLRRTRGDTPESGAELARELGCLPIALEQARAYIEAAGSTREEYLSSFRRRPPTPSPDLVAEEYIGTVAATWRVSIENVEARQPGAKHLLELLSFFDAEDIPRSRLLTDGLRYLTRELALLTESFEAFDEAVKELTRYSLVQVSLSSLRVHRLIQAVVRTTLSHEKQRDRVGLAVDIIASLFPTDISKASSWPLCDRLIGHALSVVAFAHSLDVELQRAAEVFDRVMTYLDQRARYIEAHSHYERFLDVVSAAHGQSSIEFARALSLVSELFYELGDLPMARDHGERAVGIAEQGRAEHPDIITILSNLGLVLMELGELDSAREHQETALRIGEGALGQDHPAVARVRSNLGVVHFEAGDRELSKECQERAYAVLSRDVSQPVGQLVARRYAVTLYDFGRLKESRVELEGALRDFDVALGDDHPEVAKTLQQLGFVLWDLGELQLARQYFERSLRIFRRAYRKGPHPAIGKTLSGLAMVLQDQGELDAALNAAREALAICEHVFGLRHLEVARRLDSLGFILRNKNSYDQAIVELRRAIEIITGLLGNHHPELAIPLTNLGLVLEEHGQPAEAEALHRAAIEIFRRRYPPDHAHTHLALSRLAVILRKQGHTAEARQILHAAIEVFIEAKGPEHPDVARAFEKLAYVYEDMGDPESAGQHFERSAAIFLRSLGPNHPRTKVGIINFQELRLRTGYPSHPYL